MADESTETAHPENVPRNCRELARMLRDAYPLRNGEELPFRLPFDKARVLVVDDGEDVCDHLRGCEIPHSSGTLQDLYDFHPLCVKHASGKSVVQTFNKLLSELLKKTPPCFYDLILLDLSLGEKPGDDPSGYQLLPILKKWYPNIPIIAYSKFDDMGHIERSFRQGATWYLPKGKEYKLPAHHAELLDNTKWRREWALIKERYDGCFSVFEEVNPEDRERFQYLALKSVQTLPGSEVQFEKLTGGISDSMTLLARKSYAGDDQRMQPVIIKIDDVAKMSLEQERYRRFIAPFLCNHVGRIEHQPIRAGHKSAITYTFTGWAGTSSRDHCTAKTVPLGTLIQDNLALQDAGTRPFSAFRPFLEKLFCQILPTIHFANPDPEEEPCEFDYPNPVLKEFPDAISHYMIRLPQGMAYELSAPLNPAVSLSRPPRALPQEAGSIDLHYVESKSEKGILRCVAQLADGVLYRVDLKGPKAGFYANFRKFREFQSFSAAVKPCAVKGATEKDDKEDELFAWRSLWGGQYSLYSFFKNGPFSLEAAEHMPRRMVALREWLCSTSVRACLNGGRTGIMHGDLNVGNVMAQYKLGNDPCPMDTVPWLIDFAETRRDKIVFDYTQFEVDWFTRVIEPGFFGEKENPDWDTILDFFQSFLSAPHKIPDAANNDRLKFIYEGMQFVYDCAMQAHISREEYLCSRVFALLIVHKIFAGRMKGQQTRQGRELYRFRALLALKLAFQTSYAVPTYPFEPEMIRVSCSGLCRIKIDDKYLLEVNRSRGDELTPIGGAHEFDCDGKAFVRRWEAECESGRDLRMRMPVDLLADFKKWFRRRKGRDISPQRELREELVDEHGALERLEDVKATFLDVKYDRRKTTKPGSGEAVTAYFAEYFEVELSDEVQKCLREAVPTKDSLFLLSKEELLAKSYKGESGKEYSLSGSCQEMLNVSGTDQ